MDNRSACSTIVELARRIVCKQQEPKGLLCLALVKDPGMIFSRTRFFVRRQFGKFQIRANLWHKKLTMSCERLGCVLV